MNLSIPVSRIISEQRQHQRAYCSANLDSDRAALALALFIGIYWTSRVLVDVFYFSHEDWPKVKQFVIGHALLTLLFSVLAVSYLGLFTWHMWLKGRV